MKFRLKFVEHRIKIVGKFTLTELYLKMENSMSEESTSKMDITEHQKTYEGFIAFSQVLIIAIFNILICLVLFGFGGGFGAVLGTFLLLATAFSVLVGLSEGVGGWIVPAIVFVLCVLSWIVVVG